MYQFVQTATYCQGTVEIMGSFRQNVKQILLKLEMKGFVSISFVLLVVPMVLALAGIVNMFSVADLLGFGEIWLS